jgi:hypothetical protein
MAIKSTIKIVAMRILAAVNIIEISTKKGDGKEKGGKGKLWGN